LQYRQVRSPAVWDAAACGATIKVRDSVNQDENRRGWADGVRA